MVKSKNKKQVEITEAPVEEPVEEQIEENLEEETAEENNEKETELNIIKQILTKKKVMSEKQRNHVESLKTKRIQSEREKKNFMKKFNELSKYNVNLDEILEDAKKKHIKNQYEKNIW